LREFVGQQALVTFGDERSRTSRPLLVEVREVRGQWARFREVADVEFRWHVTDPQGWAHVAHVWKVESPG